MHRHRRQFSKQCTGKDGTRPLNGDRGTSQTHTGFNQMEHTGLTNTIVYPYVREVLAVARYIREQEAIQLFNASHLTHHRCLGLKASLQTGITTRGPRLLINPLVKSPSLPHRTPWVTLLNPLPAISPLASL